MARKTQQIEIVGPAVERFDERLFDLLPYQKRDVESASRFPWSCWARQTGKSYSKSLRRIVRGLARGKSQIFLSAGERQSRELMTKAADHLKKLQRGFELSERSEVFDDARFNVMEINIPGAIRIIGLPASPATARGYTGDVLLDEFAMHGTQDSAIYASAFGSITRSRGELDVCSTPMGRLNMFYRLRENDIFEHEVLDIHQAVEQGCPADPEELRRGLGDDRLWRQEYLCEFIDEGEAFLTYELIARCEQQTLARDLDLAALQERKETDVVVGIDVGREKHPTVIWLFALQGLKFTHLGIVELVGTSFREQHRIIAEILRCKSVRRCCIDKSGLGMQLAEELTGRFGTHKVEGIQFTIQMKETLAGGLRVKFEDGNIAIPVCEKIRRDLHSIACFTTAGGHVRYQPLGAGDEHADRFWSAALAVYAQSGYAGKIEGVVGGRSKYEGMRGIPRGSGSMARGGDDDFYG